MVFKKYLPPRHPSTIFRTYGAGRRHEGFYFVDAFLRVLISGELKNILALSFDRDFRAMGLTTIS
jgi:hypothetical protein